MNVISLEKYNDLLKSPDKDNNILGWTMIIYEFKRNINKITLDELTYLKIIVSSRNYEPLFLRKKRVINISQNLNLLDCKEKHIFLYMIDKKLKKYSSNRKAKSFEMNHNKIFNNGNNN